MENKEMDAFAKFVYKMSSLVADGIGLKDDETINLIDEEGFSCIRCWYQVRAQLMSPFAYCPKCGRKVVKKEDNDE